MPEATIEVARFKAKQRRAAAEKRSRAERDRARMPLAGPTRSRRAPLPGPLDLGQAIREATARRVSVVRDPKGVGRALMARAAKYGRMAAIAPAAQQAKWRRRADRAATLAERIFDRLKSKASVASTNAPGDNETAPLGTKAGANPAADLPAEALR